MAPPARAGLQCPVNSTVPLNYFSARQSKPSDRSYVSFQIVRADAANVISAGDCCLLTGRGASTLHQNLIQSHLHKDALAAHWQHQ